MALYGRDLAYVHAAGFEGWIDAGARELLTLLRRGGVRRGARVVDLGCGSGRWAHALAQAGYRALGIDVSPGMIALARRGRTGAEFRTGTIARAPLPRCQAVTAFGECFNYRVGRDPSLGVLFGRVHRALAPGGLFVFDAREPSRAPALDRSAHAVGRDWAVMVRVSERGAALTRSITTFRRSGRAYRRSDEVHRLRLFTRTEVLRALRRAGFSARVWPARRTAVADHGPPSLARFVARA